MDDGASPADARRSYEQIFGRAVRYARRMLSGDRAVELAHDVTVELLNRPGGEPPSGPVLYLAVVRRLRDASRASRRRAAREAAYVESRPGHQPGWAVPGSDLEARELGDRIAQVVARMPRGMRDAFLLVREERLSYREAAERLGVEVGTIHTQLARAGALLRACVQAYHADSAPSSRQDPRTPGRP